MSLSSLHLDTFVAVARLLNFSKATESLFITQSALSQRIETPYYTKHFMGETYGIIAGVETGLGKSVMPVHLLAGRPH